MKEIQQSTIQSHDIQLRVFSVKLFVSNFQCRVFCVNFSACRVFCVDFSACRVFCVNFSACRVFSIDFSPCTANQRTILTIVKYNSNVLFSVQIYLVQSFPRVPSFGVEFLCRVIFVQSWVQSPTATEASHILGPEELTARFLSVDFVEKYRMHEKNAQEYFCVDCSDLQKRFLSKIRSHEPLTN